MYSVVTNCEVVIPVKSSTAQVASKPYSSTQHSCLSPCPLSLSTLHSNIKNGHLHSVVYTGPVHVLAITYLCTLSPDIVT